MHIIFCTIYYYFIPSLQKSSTFSKQMAKAYVYTIEVIAKVQYTPSKSPAGGLPNHEVTLRGI